MTARKHERLRRALAFFRVDRAADNFAKFRPNLAPARRMVKSQVLHLLLLSGVVASLYDIVDRASCVETAFRSARLGCVTVWQLEPTAGERGADRETCEA
jgi:hypothetical protein